MKFYFHLQMQRLFRWLKHRGVHPVFALVVGVVLFLLLSNFLFYKTVLAKWIYPVLPIIIVLALSATNRNDLLKTIFDRASYILARVMENGIVVLPFVLYLIYEGEYLVSLTLITIALLLSYYTSRQNWNKTIPTPFKKFPFEFIVGFRKTFWFIIMAYFLIVKGMQVDNYNLSLFGLFLLFLCSMTYYGKAEDEYFVWIYNVNAITFLKKKLFTSLICISILTILGLVMLLLGFPKNLWITLGVYILGYVFLTSMIVVKYSAFPHEMNVPQALLYAISLILPPMLFITIWIFYSQSKKRLEPILG